MAITPTIVPHYETDPDRHAATMRELRRIFIKYGILPQTLLTLPLTSLIMDEREEEKNDKLGRYNP